MFFRMFVSCYTFTNVNVRYVPLIKHHRVVIISRMFTETIVLETCFALQTYHNTCNIFNQLVRKDRHRKWIHKHYSGTP